MLTALTEVLRNSNIPHSRFPILKLWVCHLYLFNIICIPTPYIPLKVGVKVNCSKDVSM